MPQRRKAIEYHLVELENGVRLVHQQVRNSPVVHCGLMIAAGSRDENESNNGIAHFIEHSVFKGTTKRKAHHILRRLENVGGELNAFTDREKTCYYAAVLKPFAGRAAELLSDMAFHSVFPEQELEKEKKVILEEIDMFEDTPEEAIYDDLYARIFKGHPLGFNILGTPQSVQGLSRNAIQDFMRHRYAGERVVLSTVGAMGPKQAEAIGRKYLESLERPASQPEARTAPAMQPVFKDTEDKDFSQAHCLFGSRAYSRYQPERYALVLLNNVLSGAGMSARLNMAVREKHGLTYQVSAHYSSYVDAGVFSVYFASDNKNVERCQDLIRRELRRLCEVRLTDRQMSLARVQLLGQVALVGENNAALMQHQAKSVLDYGRVLGFESFKEAIMGVTADAVLEAAREVLHPDKMSLLVYRGEEEDQEAE